MVRQVVEVGKLTRWSSCVPGVSSAWTVTYAGYARPTKYLCTNKHGSSSLRESAVEAGSVKTEGSFQAVLIAASAHVQLANGGRSAVDSVNSYGV